MKKQKSKTNEVYQLKVTLKGSRPKIWRRILVKSTTNLYTLHFILQRAMGWQQEHQHMYDVLGQNYGCSDPNWGNPNLNNERKFTLSQIVALNTETFVYEYDFGDGWEHEIKIEKVLPAETACKYPVCIGGQLACPPEDCGGIWGYYGLLDAIKDPKHEDHDRMMEWLGEDFDPHHFELEEINRTIANS